MRPICTGVLFDNYDVFISMILILFVVGFGIYVVVGLN